MTEPAPDRTRAWRACNTALTAVFVTVAVVQVFVEARPDVEIPLSVWVVELAILLAVSWALTPKRRWWGLGPARYVAEQKAKRDPAERRFWRLVSGAFLIWFAALFLLAGLLGNLPWQ